MNQLDWKEYANFARGRVLGLNEYQAHTPLGTYAVWDDGEGQWLWQYSAMRIDVTGAVHFRARILPVKSFSEVDAKSECYVHWRDLVGEGGEVVLKGTES